MRGLGSGHVTGVANGRPQNVMARGEGQHTDRHTNGYCYLSWKTALLFPQRKLTDRGLLTTMAGHEGYQTIIVRRSLLVC